MSATPETNPGAPPPPSAVAPERRLGRPTRRAPVAATPMSRRPTGAGATGPSAFDQPHPIFLRLNASTTTREPVMTHPSTDPAAVHRSTSIAARPLPALALALACTPLAAGTVDSGSDGSDGALELTYFQPKTIELDPRDPTGEFGGALDADGDNQYHFTSVHIGPNVTLKLSSRWLGSTPVVWRVSGDVLIEGTIDLDGEPGHDDGEPSLPSFAGAGGYGGGKGGRPSAPGTAGSGPGAGGYAIVNAGGVIGGGGGAAHAANGTDAPAYGNRYLLPLRGGSGGGGGWTDSSYGVGGAGGGAGGGALSIVSETRVDIMGAVTAKGGAGGSTEFRNSLYGIGGGGSGGAIRIVAPVVDGDGEFSVGGSANGLCSYCATGSGGRIRLETFDYQFTGTQSGSGDMVLSTPGVIDMPETAPTLRVVSVNGVPVPANPRGYFDPADLRIDATEAVPFEIEAPNVPLGTVVDLSMVSEVGETTTFSVMLEGKNAQGIPVATVHAGVPHGFSRLYIQADWLD